MLIPSTSQFRVLSSKTKVLLGVVLALWFLSSSLVNAHQDHPLEHDSHCALCLAHGTLDHALPSFILSASQLCELQVILTPHLVDAPTVVLQLPGNRDPPLIF